MYLRIFLLGVGSVTFLKNGMVLVKNTSVTKYLLYLYTLKNMIWYSVDSVQATGGVPVWRCHYIVGTLVRDHSL